MKEAEKIFMKKHLMKEICTTKKQNPKEDVQKDLSMLQEHTDLNSR